MDAESASTSPSPSTSIAKTDRAPSAVLEMTRSEKETLAQNTVGRGVGAAEAACAPQPFSYHATASS